MREGPVPKPALPAALYACLVSGMVFSTLGVSAQTRSAVHPLAVASAPKGQAVRVVNSQSAPEPLGLAVTGQNWSAYSRAVNRINAFAERGSETWLATDMGVKVVDRSRHLVTHFTQLDGLPDNRVLAVATTADSAWSVVAAKHGEALTADLCEYNQTERRWHVLRSAPRPVTPTVVTNYMATNNYVPGAALENCLVSACAEKACFAVSPLKSADHILALVYDRRLKLWDEIPALPEFTADPSTLSITWLNVDRDGVWVASTAGLLRYQFREKHWARYLRDRMVYAATKAEDGTIWAATYVRSTAPIDRNAPAIESNFVSGHWFATHFTPKTGQAVHDQVPAINGRGSGYGIRVPLTFSGISLAGSSVWLTPGSRTPLGTQTPYYRFEIRDASWRSYSSQNPVEIDSVPDIALDQPTLPRGTLQRGSYPWRMREWVCRDAPEDSLSAMSRNPQSSKDLDGTVWVTDGRGLVQTDQRGTVLRRFGTGRVTVPVTPPVSAVTVVNGALYALSSGEVQAYDLNAGTWRRVHLPRSNWSNPADERLIPDGNRVWIGTPATAYRYDPATQLFSVESTTQNGGYRLLGAIGGIAWLRGPDNLLYTADANTGEPEPAEFPQVGPDILAEYERPAPFALESGIMWFRLVGKKEPDRQLYVGYHLGKRKWTAHLAVKRSNQMPPTCATSNDTFYIPLADDTGAIACYNTAADRWSFAATKPTGTDLQNVSVISADDREIWILDSGRRLMSFQRREKTWTAHELPAGLWIQQYGNEVVRSGNSIYVATNTGVWEYRIATNEWKALPGFPSREIYLSTLAVDSRAVWSIARPPNGNQAFALRFDKASHQWSYWTEKDGFPERAYPPNIVADGAGAWVLAAGYCYHLSPGADRWENVSARIGQIAEPPKGVVAVKAAEDNPATWAQVSALESDGDAVWMLMASRVGKTANGSSAPLVVRFDRASSRLDYLEPGTELGPNVVGSGLQVDHAAVWVPTQAGVFRLDKTNNKWRKVDPPAAAAVWSQFTTQRVTETGNTVMFFGADTAIRWTTQ